MTFPQAIVTCYRKFLVFSGRATRPEYWWFTLYSFLVAMAVSVVMAVLLFSAISTDGSIDTPTEFSDVFSAAEAGLLALLYLGIFVGVGLPSLAVTVSDSTTRTGPVGTGSSV